MPCELAYIPQYLHRDGRPLLPKFFLEEVIYRRCKESEKKDPFNSISLYDVSVNRSGLPDNILCQREDTFYNTNPENGKGDKITDEVICDLTVKELDEESKYYKALSSVKKDAKGNDTEVIDTCIIHLQHKPEECNYSHCAFVFFYNGEEIENREKYGATLGNNRPLRTKCKHELAKLIIKEEIRITD